MCYVVNRSKKEGQSPGLMEVDAVCRVLLLEVEQASSKQLQLSWACQLDYKWKRCKKMLELQVEHNDLGSPCTGPAGITERIAPLKFAQNAVSM